MMRTSFVCLTLLGAVLGPQADGYHVFMFTNRCPFPIWLALSGNAGNEHFDLKGVKLEPKHGTGMPFPNAWSGRIWARTSCNESGHCETGNCDPENNCQKSGPSTAATVAYFSLDSMHNQDYYQVSLVNGFNIPIEIEPFNHPNRTYDALGEHCVPTGCKHDLKAQCPGNLAVKDAHHKVVACRSACQAFGTDEYCCRGSHRKESHCKSSKWPTDYAKMFHSACPGAKAYLHDSSSAPHYCESNSVRFNVNFCIRQEK